MSKKLGFSKAEAEQALNRPVDLEQVIYSLSYADIISVAEDSYGDSLKLTNAELRQIADKIDFPDWSEVVRIVLDNVLIQSRGLDWQDNLNRFTKVSKVSADKKE